MQNMIKELGERFPQLTTQKLRAIVEPFLDTREEVAMQDRNGTLLAFFEGAFWQNPHILITMDNPGAYGAVKPIIEALIARENYHVTVLASGKAREYFERDFKNWKDRTGIKGPNLIFSLLQHVKEFRLDTCLGTVTSDEGPETIALYGGKSVLGAEKIFFMVEGWSGIGATFRSNREKMDKIDGVICNDDFSGMMIRHHFPELNENQILKIGTPNVEALGYEDGEVLRAAGRSRFNLGSDVTAVLYIGDVSEDYDKDYPGINPDINAQSFRMTLAAMISCARLRPSHKFAFLFRPHPRDTEKENLYEIARGMTLPSNLVFHDAANPVPMAEASYAADVVTSIISTENFLASKRGRLGVFLGYEDGKRDMGGELLRQIYGEIPEEIRKGELLTVVSSMEEFAAVIGRFSQYYGATRPQPISCLKRIVDLLF